MEQNRNILFVAQIFNFRVNGDHKLFTEQPFTCIDCPLDQWLASEINQKFITAKTFSLSGSHNDAAAFSIWLIQIND